MVSGGLSPGSRAYDWANLGRQAGAPSRRRPGYFSLGMAVDRGSFEVNATEYCEGWKQARVFSKYTGPQWYPEILVAVVAPLTVEFPENPLFFSKYACPLNKDVGDTEIQQLPPEFRIPNQGDDWHLSVRLRFRGSDQIEGRLAELIDSDTRYWYSESGKPFRVFDLIKDIGSTRFSPSQENSARERRARLVAEALRANNLVVLDAILGPPSKFEENMDGFNAPGRSTFISMGHMYNNVWEDYSGQPLPILLQRGNLERL